MGSKCFSVVAATVVVAFVTSTNSSGIVIRHDRSQQDYKNLGASSKYTSVGQFTGTGEDAGGAFSFSASGTLIAPGWVLTAGHVVGDATSLSFHLNGNTYSGAGWAAHPNWNGDVTGGYDFGLVQLASSPGVTAATRYRGTSELGKTGTYVGFGMSGTGLTGATFFDGLKRGATNAIDLFYNSNNRILTSDFDRNKGGFNLEGSRKPTNLEGLVAPGDSGGGLFIDVSGQAQLAGVISFVGATFFDLNPDSDYGDFSGAMRVSAVNSWIDSTLASGLPASLLASLALGSELAAIQVPEPTVSAALAVGLFLVAGLRRRRPRA